jgi:YrbI family 3-deoxy-D-manno-octulosonate 8-phosphate phosphatase
VRDKVAAMEIVMKRHSLMWEEVAYIGDDVNDLEVMKRVGFAVTPSDATDENKKVAHYIAKKKGGEGCVRELCDMLLTLHKRQ